MRNTDICKKWNTWRIKSLLKDQNDTSLVKINEIKTKKEEMKVSSLLSTDSNYKEFIDYQSNLSVARNFGTLTKDAIAEYEGQALRKYKKVLKERSTKVVQFQEWEKKCVCTVREKVNE